MSKITKAVIAAAGRGTRFLPVTKAYAKELVPILNKPQIQYLVEECIGAGITDICLVTRSDDNSVQKYFSADENLEKYLTENNKLAYLDTLKSIWSKAKLTFISQSADLPYGNGSPIIAAKDFIGTDDFVYMFGDDLTVEKEIGRFLSQMMAIYEQYQPSLIAGIKDVGRSEIGRYGCAKFVDDPKYPHRISAMLEKLPAEQAPSTFAQGGRYILSNQVLTVLKKQKTGMGNELWLADAENYLAQNAIVLTHAFDVESDWYTTGDPINWLKANIAIAKLYNLSI